MADPIKGPGGNKPINPNRPDGEIKPPKKPKGSDGINPEDVGTHPRGGSKLPGDTPNIPKPQSSTPPTEAELKGVVSYLKEFIKQLKENVTIDSGNIFGLLNLYEKLTPKKLTPDDLSKIGEMLASKSPEELAALLDLALTKYGIGEDGEFTEKFKAFLQNPPMEPPSGPNQEEAYSFFTLMLLLHKLSSSQRTAMFKSMQLEQKSIQASFQSKIDNITQKTTAELWLTVATVGAGVMSFVGALKGGAQSTNIGAQVWSSLGRTAGEVASTGGGAGIRLKFDPEKEKIEAGQQQANFNKDIYSQSKQAASELQNSVIQAAEDFTRQAASAKSTIRQGMA